jgi:hypothetical protein
LYAVTFGPTAAISAKSVQVEPWHRSILKPSSLFALSRHERFIRLEEAAAAIRLLGAAGGRGCSGFT